MRPYSINSFASPYSRMTCMEVLGVVPVYFFKFGAVNVFLPFFTEQSLHLVVCKSEERFHMALGKKKLGPSRYPLPRVSLKLKWGKQKMQSGGVSPGCESCPFNQRVKTDVHIGWPIAAEFVTGSENKMLLALKPKNLVGWRNVESIPVRVIGRTQFCTVSLGASDVRHN